MKYLKNNDIVIILVIFLLFCLFLFKGNLEGFQNSTESVEPTAPVDPIFEKRNNKKKLLLSFIRNIEFSINKIQLINESSKNIIKNLFENKYDYKKVYSDITGNEIFTMITNLFNEYKDVSDIEIFENLDKKDLKELFDKFKETHNEILYKNYVELFEKSNSNVSSRQINICPDGISLKPEANIYNFFTNLKNSANVIFNSNPLSVDIIEQNIKQIKSELVLFNLRKKTKDEIYSLLNEYTQLLQVVFNNRLNFDIVLILNSIVDCNSKTKNELLRNHDLYNQHLNYINFQINNIKGTLINVLELLEGDVNDIFLDDDDNKNFFEISRKNMELEQKFCDKLAKLDKPKKNNLIFKRFSEEVISKKKKYIEDLNKKIESIYSSMTENEINEYNLNRIRIDEHASKQYEAIKKGISNIKNKNKIKINLY